MALFGSIVGAVAGPLLGAFGRKSEERKARAAHRESRKYDRKALKRLRIDAEKNGFNPLTVLQASGLPPPSTAAPVLSSSDFLAEGATRLADVWTNRPTARDAELDRIQLETARANLDSVLRQNAAPLSRSFGYSIPSITDGIGQSQSSTAAAFGRFPVLVDGADGLSRVNPILPVEPEQDLWGWLREGSLIPNILRLGKKNIAYTFALGRDNGRANREAASAWLGSTFAPSGTTAPQLVPPRARIGPTVPELPFVFSSPTLSGG